MGNVKLIIEDAPTPERLSGWLKNVAHGIDGGYNNGFIEPKWRLVDPETDDSVTCKVNFAALEAARPKYDLPKTKYLYLVNQVAGHHYIYMSEKCDKEKALADFLNDFFGSNGQVSNERFRGNFSIEPLQTRNNVAEVFFKVEEPRVFVSAEKR